MLPRMRFIGMLVIVAAAFPAVLADGAPSGNDATGIDARLLRVGDVVARGSQVDGACVFPPVAEHVAVSPDAPFFHASVRVTQDCAAVLDSVCVDPAACPLLAAQAMAPAATDALEPIAIRASHCPSQSRVKVDYWTEGVPGTTDNGEKVDVLTEVWRDVTWSWNCADNSPHIVTASRDCLEASWNNWHEHACLQEECQVQTGTTCRGTEGEFECHFNANFCSFTNYLHTLHAYVRGWNDGGAMCYRLWEGEMPPKMDWTCAYV